MSDDAPILGVTASELVQWITVANTISRLVAAVRAQREREARLAYADSEHAARLIDSRAFPPLRLMTEAEQAEWTRRVPSELSGQQHREPVSVWTARLGEGWGVEAHTWDASGAPTATVFAVCRDGEDAVDLCRWIRKHGKPEVLGRLHAVAAAAEGQFVGGRTEERGGRQLARRREVDPLVLSEADWVAALRAAFPDRWADRIAATDPTDPRHAAWRELHKLANSEVVRVGADPVLLARQIRTGAMWLDGRVDNPPALAYYALTRARERSGYEDRVRRVPAGSQPSAPSGLASTTADSVPGAVETRVPRDQIRTPQQALAWAQGLDTSNPQDRLEAKQEYGRWGTRVDTELAGKFPGLLAAARAASDRVRRRRDAQAAGQPEAAVVEPELDAASLAKTIEDVKRFDPAKVGGRMAAHAMLGHVSPEVDRLLAERFGNRGDDRFDAKLAELYPDGLPEAAAWRARADLDDKRAAARFTVADNPTTARREDADGRTTARRADEDAAAERRVSVATAARRTPAVAPAGPQRRVR